MRRTLDMTALRALLAVQDHGGVTRAANVLNLTQSAVSMQIRRLEDSLGLALFERKGRAMLPTQAGDQLISYARRMLALNDEVVSRLTDRDLAGEIRIAMPYDIVTPIIPPILQAFQRAYPRMKVQLQATVTSTARALFADGACDLILTTEDHCPPGAETLSTRDLVWIGARGGQCWQERPLRLAVGRVCAFRAGVIAALDAAGIPWTAAVESESDRTLEAAVACDMAVNALLAGTEPASVARIEHGGALPDLTRQKINLYLRPDERAPGVLALAEMMRLGWAGDGAVTAPSLAA
ncbi:MAG: LysR family transcriptional regulator [Roseinatronobacter sp.]